MSRAGRLLEQTGTSPIAQATKLGKESYHALKPGIQKATTQVSQAGQKVATAAKPLIQKATQARQNSSYDIPDTFSIISPRMLYPRFE